MSITGNHFYDFDRFRVDVAERTLTSDGEIVPLTQKAFDVLLVLIERRGQIVGKEELMQQVWPDTFVEEGNLSQNIYTLRKVLGQTLDGQEFIKTVPKRGYRFAPPVTERKADDKESDQGVPAYSVQESGSTDLLDSESPPRDSVIVQFPVENPLTQERTLPVNQLEGWSSRHRAVAAVTATVLMLGSLVSLLWLAEVSDWQLFASRPAGRTSITNLTTTGNIACAAVSPDGKYAAYGITENAQRGSLWLMQLSTLTSQQIIAPAEVQYHALTFSRDGQFIYYVSVSNNQPRTLFRVSVLGGPSGKLIENVHTAVSFSPDGSRLVFRRSIDERREAVLFIANADGSGEKEIASIKYPEGFGDPAWSPDGEVIACAAGHTQGGANMYVVAVRADDGAMKPISAQKFRWIGQLAWTPDSNSLMMVAGQGLTEIYQVWRLDYSTGETQRVTNDSNQYNRLSLSADAKTMVVRQTRQLTNVWIIPRETPEQMEQVTFGAGGYRGRLSWTPDGRIAYDSEVGNAGTISVMNADGGHQKLLLGAQTNKAYVGRTTVSPDGRYVVFASDAAGTRHIWRMDIDGNNLKQLTNGEGEDTPHCSPDGRWVVYTKLERQGAGSPTLGRVSIDGGELTQLTTTFTAYPAVSPDGKMIACLHSDPNQPWRLAIYPFEGGEPIKVFPQAIGGVPMVRWTPDGRYLTYDDNPIGPAGLWLQPVEGGEPKLLAEFVSDRIFGFDWSPDGSRLALVRGIWAANALLIRDFK